MGHEELQWQVGLHVPYCHDVNSKPSGGMNPSDGDGVLCQKEVKVSMPNGGKHGIMVIGTEVLTKGSIYNQICIINELSTGYYCFQVQTSQCD